ncbi:MAG: hypothetical protein ACTHXB_11955, partial [Luteimonas sp.]
MRQVTTGGLVFKKLPLFIAVMGCLYGAPALAQEQDELDQIDQQEEQPVQQTTSAEQPTELDRMTVTGSLIRRVEYDST